MPSAELSVAIQQDFKTIWDRLSAHCKEQKRPHYTASIGARGTLHVQLLESHCGFSVIDATLPTNAVFVSKSISIVPHMHKCEKVLEKEDLQIRQTEINAAANIIEAKLLDLAKTYKYNIVHETDCEDSPTYFDKLFRSLSSVDYKLNLMCAVADQMTRDWIFTDLHNKNRVALTQADFLNCDKMLEHLCYTCFRFPLTDVYWMELDQWKPNFTLIAQYNGISPNNVRMVQTDFTKQKFELFQGHIAAELDNSTKRKGITEAELKHLIIRNKSLNDWIKSWKLPGIAPKLSSATNSPSLGAVASKNLLGQDALLTAFENSKSNAGTNNGVEDTTLSSSLSKLTL